MTVDIQSLSQTQIATLRSMFELIDQDGDGLISEHDLATTFKSIGETEKSTDTKLHKSMLKESESDLNFAGFLSLIVQKNTMSSSENLKKSFALFNIRKDDSAEMDMNTTELTRNLLDSKTGLAEDQIKNAMSRFIKEDLMTKEEVFMGGRFISSVAI